jgi:hypothetical protein
MSLKSGSAHNVAVCKYAMLATVVLDLLFCVVEVVLQQSMANNRDFVITVTQLKWLIGTNLVLLLLNASAIAMCCRLIYVSRDVVGDSLVENLTACGFVLALVSFAWGAMAFENIDHWYKGGNEFVVDIYSPFVVLHWSRLAMVLVSCALVLRLRACEKRIISLVDE